MSDGKSLSPLSSSSSPEVQDSLSPKQDANNDINGISNTKKSSTGTSIYPSSTFWKCENPVTITVRDLVYAVPAKEILPGCNTMLCSSTNNSRDSLVNKKVLLDKVNLIAKPGELLAIVGPSGGGKTTLLNILAMRSPKWRIPSGHVKFNGRIETKHSLKSTTNYVMAHDKLLPYLTVYETLCSAASLKLPNLSKDDQRRRVERVIDDMCLQKCRDSLVGGDWKKGISTGEIKRVAIGMELLDEPAVLILDEPTSQLDSSLSAKIIDLLVKEARKGRTVICTVHQPSSQVFEMFDKFLLISSGRVVYHGPADSALSYFAGLGYYSDKDWNPCDFLLDLVSIHPSRDEEERKNTLNVKSPSHLSEGDRASLSISWESSDMYKSLLSEVAEVEAAVDENKIGRAKADRQGDGVRVKRNIWLYQVATLWKRTSLNSVRNPLSVVVAILIQIMQGLVLGGIFFNLTSNVTSGPKPDAMLGPQFWDSPWAQYYVNGYTPQPSTGGVSAAQIREPLRESEFDENGKFGYMNDIGLQEDLKELKFLMATSSSQIGRPNMQKEELVKKSLSSVNERRYRPLLDVYEKGMDGKGSYILGNSTGEDGTWIIPIKKLMHNTVECVYNKQIADKSYPFLPYRDINNKKEGVGFDATHPSFEDWPARYVYSDIMAGYQIFDLLYSTFDPTFLKRCKVTESGKPNTMYYVCIQRQGKKQLDPLVTCVGMRELPDTGGRLLLSEGVTEEQEGDWEKKEELTVKSKGEVFTGSRNKYRLIEQQADRKNIKRPNTNAPSPLLMTKNESKQQQNESTKRQPLLNSHPSSTSKRLLTPLSGGMKFDETVEEIIGSDMMKFITAGKTWIQRLTGCSNSLCQGFESIVDFIEEWSSSTIATIAAVLNITGCLFFVVANMGFASYDALLTFPQERALFNRETANGLYTPSSYYIAKNLADLPFQMIPSLVMATIYYFMVGLQVTFHQYAIYFGICIISSFCAYGFGYMVSAASPRMEIAILIAPLTLVIWLVLAGFFLRDADIPSWIGWFKYLSFYRWSFFSLVINQFPPGGYYGTLPNTLHLKLCGVTETNIILTTCILLSLGLLYRILGYVFLASMNRRVGLEA